MGSGKENEMQFKQNKVYGSKDRQRKRRRSSESQEHSKNQKTKILRITINEKGDLKVHIVESKQKCEIIIRKIEIIGSRNQFGKEKLRVQLKLFESCFVPALVHGIEAWGYLKKGKIKEIERIQGKTLKRLFKLPVSTTYRKILMGRGIWPAEQIIQNATLILYHNIKNSNEEKKVKMIDE